MTWALAVSTSILAFPRLASLVTRSASRAATAASAASPRGSARIELPLRLGEHCLVDNVLLHHLRQTSYFGLPANDFRLILSHVRSCLGQLSNRRLDIALGHHDQLLGLLDQTSCPIATCAVLLLMIFVQFGDKNLSQQLAFFHLVADVHVEVLDEPGYLRKIEVCSKASTKPGCSIA